jgi:hypothetical protein
MILDEDENLVRCVEGFSSAIPAISVAVRQLDLPARGHPSLDRHKMPKDVRLMDCGAEPLTVKNRVESGCSDYPTNLCCEFFAFSKDNRLQDQQTARMGTGRYISSES